jgi:hypothetical protein
MLAIAIGQVWVRKNPTVDLVRIRIGEFTDKGVKVSTFPKLGVTGLSYAALRENYSIEYDPLPLDHEDDGLSVIPVLGAESMARGRYKIGFDMSDVPDGVIFVGAILGSVWKGMWCLDR